MRRAANSPVPRQHPRYGSLRSQGRHMFWSPLSPKPPLSSLRTQGPITTGSGLRQACSWQLSQSRLPRSMGPGSAPRPRCRAFAACRTTPVVRHALAKTSAVVPANAGTHNHRERFEAGLELAARSITSAAEYGSRLKAGTTLVALLELGNLIRCHAPRRRSIQYAEVAVSAECGATKPAPLRSRSSVPLPCSRAAGLRRTTTPARPPRTPSPA